MQLDRSLLTQHPFHSCYQRNSGTLNTILLQSMCVFVLQCSSMFLYSLVKKMSKQSVCLVLFIIYNQNPGPVAGNQQQLLIFVLSPSAVFCHQIMSKLTPSLCLVSTQLLSQITLNRSFYWKIDELCKNILDFTYVTFQAF